MPTASSASAWSAGVCVLFAINAWAHDWEPAWLVFLGGAVFLVSWALWLSTTRH
jgi:hypothetical protein